MADINTLLDGIPDFLTKIFDTLNKDGVDVSNYELDHVCYRVETQERYQHCKRELATLGELLGESIVNGRPIATYKLRNPIAFRSRKIFCFELPAPKDRVPYVEGLEHAEFVIDIGFEEFMNLYPHIVFNKSAISIPVNPEIQIKYDGFSAKFHHQPLEQVIANEK